VAQHYREPSGHTATQDCLAPIDVHVSKAARLHQTTVPDVDELRRSLSEILDCTSYIIHSDSEFSVSPAQRPASRRRDRDLSWILIAYLVGTAGILSAAAYQLLP
jgi:hypothetical protein